MQKNLEMTFNPEQKDIQGQQKNQQVIKSKEKEQIQQPNSIEDTNQNSQQKEQKIRKHKSEKKMRSVTIEDQKTSSSQINETQKNKSGKEQLLSESIFDENIQKLDKMDFLIQRDKQLLNKKIQEIKEQCHENEKKIKQSASFERQQLGQLHIKMNDELRNLIKARNIYNNDKFSKANQDSKKSSNKQNINLNLSNLKQDDNNQILITTVQTERQNLFNNSQERTQRTQYSEIPKKFLENKKPLFQVLQEQYEQNQLLPQLESRKRILAEKRALNKPIDIQQLENHQKKYQDLINQQEEKRNSQKNESLSQLKQFQKYQSRYHKSIFYEQCLNKESDFFQNQLKEKLRIQEFLQKKKIFSENLFKNHKETIQSKNKNEQEGQEENIQEHQKKKSFDRKRIMSIGNDYLQYVKKLKKKSFLDEEAEEAEVSNSQVVKSSISSINLNQNKYKNYLKESKRFQKQKKGLDDINAEILNDQNLNSIQKIEILNIKAKQLEENAQRQKQLEKLHISRVQVENREETKQKHINGDDMFYDALKTKLAILNSLHSQGNEENDKYF